MCGIGYFLSCQKTCITITLIQKRDYRNPDFEIFYKRAFLAVFLMFHQDFVRGTVPPVVPHHHPLQIFSNLATSSLTRSQKLSPQLIQPTFHFPSQKPASPPKATY